MPETRTRPPLGFTAEEIAAISGAYDGTPETIDELAERFPGHPRWHFARIGRMAGKAKRRAAWSVKDEDYLKERLGVYPLATIAKRLGRTDVSVRLKMKRLGLNQKTNTYTMRAVAKIFGVDSHKVLDQWIAGGLMKAKAGPYTQGPHRVWSITYEEIERFIKRHPEQYDWRRMPYSYFRNVAKRVYDEDPPLSVNEFARLTGLSHEMVRRYLRQGRIEGTRVCRWSWYGGWRIRASQAEMCRAGKVGR